MKYKDFEFPTNPSKIEVQAERNISVKPSLNRKWVNQNVSENPVKITGSGIFYGDSAQTICNELQRLVSEESSGWLFAPTIEPVKAFFESFTYSKDTSKNRLDYSFIFKEDMRGRNAKHHFSFTYADENENAFDIANRTGVSVNKIMEINDFSSPFEIEQGSKVRLI